LIAGRLVPERMWQAVAARLPPPVRRPQGGGRNRADARACLVAITYALTATLGWRKLPANELGVSVPTVFRRWVEWTAGGLWTYLLDSFHEPVEVITVADSDAAWIRAVAYTALRRAEADQARAHARTARTVVPARSSADAVECERRAAMDRCE
jgi:transposase